jgi:hypothetical protein
MKERRDSETHGVAVDVPGGVVGRPGRGVGGERGGEGDGGAHAGHGRAESHVGTGWMRRYLRRRRPYVGAGRR